MTTETAARVFHRDQLDEWGVPYDLATDPTTAPEGTAVELHHEQVATRRWVSVHELVFRAPDDGRAYRVTYQQGLTEQQDGVDEWDDRDHIVGEEVEAYERPVKAWRRVGSQPATVEAPNFFQPGRTYQRRRWQFQCLAVAPAPHTGEARAVGFLYRLDETPTAAALDPDDWAHGEWTTAEAQQ
ncbi:hypothetical protein [Streptomyces sp. NPDC003299]